MSIIPEEFNKRIEELNELKGKLDKDTRRLIQAQKDVDRDIICIDRATDLIREMSKAMSEVVEEKELQVEEIKSR